MSTAALEMAKFVSGITYEDLPEEVRYKAKLCLLDTLGCALGACHHPDITKLKRALQFLEGKGNYTIWGEKERASLGASITANSSMAHTFDFDDFHRKGKVHCGAVIIPAVLGVAEYLEVNGKEVITAIVAGYEVMLRVAMALDAAAHRLQGWHATATCGTLGAAAAVGKLLGLDAYWLANALGTAGTQSGGLWAFTADGAMTKKFHTGRAAWSGALAALMAREGFTGPTKIFEAKDGGFLRAFSSNPHVDVLTAGLGEEWEILQVGFKPYACCRTVQPAIAAAVELRTHYRLNWEEVKQAEIIKVYTYEVAKKQNDLPLPPSNPNMAQFNLPFLIALALREGNIQIGHFTWETIHDADLLAVAEKIKIEVDPEIEERFPARWSSRLEVVTSGRSIVTSVDFCKGDPESPLTLEEHLAKFNSLLSISPYPHLASFFSEKILHLEHKSNLREVLFSLSL